MSDEILICPKCGSEAVKYAYQSGRTLTIQPQSVYECEDCNHTGLKDSFKIPYGYKIAKPKKLGKPIKGQLSKGLRMWQMATGEKLYGDQKALKALAELYEHVRRRYKQIDLLKEEIQKLKRG
jgi:transposase-like protein